jgi:hypothetical protein
VALTPPGILAVDAGDGLPLELRLSKTDGALPEDGLSWSFRSGETLAYPLDGRLDIPVEPGTYRIFAHRGARWEVDEATVEVGSGQTVDVALTLTESVSLPGWWSADTHMHAAPSFDGELSMADRLVVSAATGVQVHVASDHDVLVD